MKTYETVRRKFKERKRIGFVYASGNYAEETIAKI